MCNLNGKINTSDFLTINAIFDYVELCRLGQSWIH